MLSFDHLNSQLSDPSLGAMNFLNEIRERFPQAISFAAGRPFESFFRVEESLAQIEKFAGGRLDALAQYGTTNGLIRADLARFLANDEGFQVAPESILVTVGCQEAMLIALMGLCRPERDVVMVADPSYIGITGAAQLLGIEVCGVRSGEQGLDLDDLRGQLAAVRARGKRPRLVYDIPDFSNPTGSSMPLERRHELLALAEAEDLLVLEDTVYRSFAYDGENPPCLKALDTKQRVIYLGTFAKAIFPGARVGFLVADQIVRDPAGAELPLTDHLSKIKSLVSVNTPPVAQALVGGLLRHHRHTLSEYKQPALAFYRRNRDVLIAALEAGFPADAGWARGIHWNRPAGGFFLVMTLPWEIDERALQISASEYGVIWVPMRGFHLKPGGQNQIRLSFSYCSPDEVREGIDRLARFVREVLAGQR